MRYKNTFSVSLFPLLYPSHLESLIQPLNVILGQTFIRESFPLLFFFSRRLLVLSSKLVSCGLIKSDHHPGRSGICFSDCDQFL